MFVAEFCSKNGHFVGGFQDVLGHFWVVFKVCWGFFEAIMHVNVYQRGVMCKAI